MNTTANKITITRIVLIPVLLVLLYLDLVYWALAVYILACVSDYIDGYIARKYDQVTSFGKFIDPLADKMLVLAAMCFFIQEGLMPGWVVAIVLLREFAVSGLRLLAIEQGIVIAAAMSGKVKTFATMIAVGVLIVIREGWIPFADFMQVFCSIVILVTTVYSGVEYFVKNIKIFRHPL